MTRTAAQPRQTAKATEARQEILAAAARMMGRVGYAKMSLRDLAAEVGMKAGSLYYHFASKDALATEVMRLGVDNVADAVRGELATHPSAAPRDRLVLAMRVHLRTLLSTSDFASAHIRCYPFAPDAVRVELTAIRRDYDKVWAAIIGDHLGGSADPIRIRHMQHAVIGALNGALEWFDPKRDDADAYIATLSDMLGQ